MLFWQKEAHMTDVELTRSLERGEIANESFHHLSHLHVAWVYLTESSGVEEAATKMRNTLQRFAASAGKSEKYHETITLFWVHLLAGTRAVGSRESLQQIVQANSRLLEKNFPLAYYSSKRLFSDKARSSWIEPDLKPLPVDATALRSSSSPGHAPDWTLSQ
jgi:hypothetical protein